MGAAGQVMRRPRRDRPLSAGVWAAAGVAGGGVGREPAGGIRGSSGARGKAATRGGDAEGLRASVERGPRAVWLASLRIGGAMALYANRISEYDIQWWGNWASLVFLIYYRIAASVSATFADLLPTRPRQTWWCTGITWTCTLCGAMTPRRDAVGAYALERGLVMG